MIDLVLLEQVLQLAHAAYVGPLDVGHEQSPVHMFHQHKGVGDQQNGGGVDDHKVVNLSRFSDELIGAVVEHKLGGIGRDGAGGHHVKSWDVCRLHSHGPRDLPNEVTTEAGAPGYIECLMDTGLVQVVIDEQGLLASLRHEGCHVGRCECLALSGVHARDEDGVLSVLVEQVLKISPQPPKCFSCRVARAFAGHDDVLFVADVFIAGDSTADGQ